MRFMCIIRKNKKHHLTSQSGGVNDSMKKKSKITNLLTKRYFEEIWYLVMYEVLLFNYQVKNTVPSSQTPVFGKNYKI